jgi:Uma2 family endonuclease
MSITDTTLMTEQSIGKKRRSAVWLIEVAVSSQRRDRGLKANLYSTGGIAEYWVVDAKAMAVYIHLDPSPDGYRSVIRYGATDPIAPRAVPDLTFSLDDLINDRVEARSLIRNANDRAGWARSKRAADRLTGRAAARCR